MIQLLFARTTVFSTSTKAGPSDDNQEISTYTYKHRLGTFQCKRKMVLSTIMLDTDWWEWMEKLGLVGLTFLRIIHKLGTNAKFLLVITTMMNT